MIHWDFHAEPSLGFTENSPKKRKYQVSGSCVDENALLMSEVRGEWAEWFQMINSNNHSTIEDWKNVDWSDESRAAPFRC